jgi:hypothetical protein
MIFALFLILLFVYLLFVYLPLALFISLIGIGAKVLKS